MLARGGHFPWAGSTIKPRRDETWDVHEGCGAPRGDIPDGNPPRPGEPSRSPDSLRSFWGGVGKILGVFMEKNTSQVSRQLAAGQGKTTACEQGLLEGRSCMANVST